jgi:hypothetical protein
VAADGAARHDRSVSPLHALRQRAATEGESPLDPQSTPTGPLINAHWSPHPRMTPPAGSPRGSSMTSSATVRCTRTATGSLAENNVRAAGELEGLRL